MIDGRLIADEHDFRRMLAEQRARADRAMAEAGGKSGVEGQIALRFAKTQRASVERIQYEMRRRGWEP